MHHRSSGRACLARVAAACLAMAAALALGAAPASAHARLTATTPAEDELVGDVPATVALQFDEPVGTTDDAVRVFGPDGSRVDAGAAQPTDGGAALTVAIEGDARGTYTVAWRVTSEDGHTLRGSFVFHVGTRTGAVAIDEGGTGVGLDLVGGVGRWSGFAGTLAAVGAAVVALLAGAGGPAAGARLRRLALGGAVVGVVGVLVALVASLAESWGRSFAWAAGHVFDLGLDSRTGRLALERAAVCLVAAMAAAVGPLWRRSPAPVALAGGVSLVLASLAGHAWTAPSRSLAVTADAVHLFAVAAWVGGVAALVVALPMAEDAPRLAERFSAMALLTAAAVAATGVVSGWQQVRTLDGLTSTGYGWLLMAKVGGFAVLVALGWLNRSRLVALVHRTAAPLLRSLRGEMAVAAVVLALTAALIQQAPPRATAAAPEPVELTVHNDVGALDATVDPARVGPNDLHLFFYGHDGAELPVDAVQVTVATGDVPARALTVTPVTPSHVVVSGASLPSPGTWTVEVTAVRQGQPSVFSFEVPIT